MPDPVVVLEALSAAVLVSGLAFRAGRRRSDGGWAWVWSLAVGLGFYLGLAVLGVLPCRPIREDQDRFVWIIVPAAIATEALLQTLRPPSRLAVVARLAAALAVAPVILYGSIYVADTAGPGSAAWVPWRRGVVHGGLGLATAGAWSGLDWIQARSGSAVRAPLALATALLASGFVIMLSGYASGGLTALPLSAALLGASLAARVAGADHRSTAPAVGLIGLSSVLMMGAFFGRLRTADAVVLFVSPLLAGLPEVHPFARLGPRFRTVLGLALTAGAAFAVTAGAWRRFAAVAADI